MASASAARRRRPTAAWTGWSAAGYSSVQDAEDDVDGDQCRGDQVGLGGQRGLERLRGALEGALHRDRHAHLRTAALIASTAWPSAAPCARLNEIVTAGTGSGG